MQVELRPLAALRPYTNNPRHNDQAVEAVAASIREFGFRQPIVIDEEGVIVVGHTRYKAALKLGLDKVPVHVATGLTPAQLKSYRLTDNQTAQLSTWDYDRLPLELGELQKLDFEMSLTGFSAEELTRCWRPGARKGRPTRTPCRRRPTRRQRNRATCGSSSTIACSAATAAGPRPWTGCWAAPRSTW
jgi:hypothetical protein